MEGWMDTQKQILNGRYLRNELDFRKVHRMNPPKIEFIAYICFLL